MNISFDFSNTKVVITGAGSGLGKDIAVAFAKSGASVVIGDLNEKEGKITVDEIINSGGKAAYIFLDVTKQDSVDHFIKESIKTFGDIDVLVNGAGVSGRFSGSPLTNTEDSDFDITYSVNVKGLYHMVKGVYDLFVNKKSGKIISITSVAGHSTNPFTIHYNTSKAAAINFTKNIAAELGKYGITANCICPGYIYTPMYEKAMPDIKQKMPHMKEFTGKEIVSAFAQKNCAIGTLQTGEDIAMAVLYLSSDAGNQISGVELDVAGGYKL